jgi:type IV pilus assembly PilP-like protein
MTRTRYIQFFLCVIGILFFIMGYDDLKERIVQLNRLSHLEKKLSLDLQKKRSALFVQPLQNKTNRIERPYDVISLKNTDILMSMVHVIEGCGFMVQTVQPLPIQTIMRVTILPIKMVLVGDIHQLATLLSHLRSDYLSAGISFSAGTSDFSLNVNEHDTVTIDMTMLVFGVHLISLPHREEKENSTKSSPSDVNEWIHTISIDQLKLVGYLHNQYSCRALVMFPNGKTKAVQIGETIGIEAARIVNITENEVVLTAGGRKKYLYFALYS